MLHIDKNGSRGATTADFLHDLTVTHLRKTTPAKFLRRSHAEDAKTRQAVNDVTGNVCVAIYGGGIKVFIQEAAKVFKCIVQLRAFGGRHSGVRHDPVCNE